MKTLVAVLVVLSTQAFAAGRVVQRQVNQQARIAEGVQSGELTAREAGRLERQEARLHREIRQDRVDGGGLTAAERAKIERKQDAMSRRIAVQKHDAQAR